MYKDIIKIITDNPVLSAGLGIYGAGVITFLIRNVPEEIFKFLKRHLTTSITITSQNGIFHDSMKWFGKEFKGKNFRTIKLSNGRYGWSDHAIKSIGYGNHWTKYKGMPILINLEKEEGNKTEYDKDTLTITKLWRAHGMFDNIIKDFKSVEKDKDKIEIYKLDERCWKYAKEQPKRYLKSVFMELEKKDALIDRLDSFIEKEEWYKDNGIPYQLGIILHGCHGTGKSSLVKVIASHLDYGIYYLDATNLSSLEDAVANLPEKSILVIEDIDSNSVTHQRDKDVRVKDNIASSLLTELAPLSLSTVLNSLDGIFSSHGRILIATTNHIEKLDPALIRPGRIDMRIEVGYVNTEIFKQFVDNFFPKNNIDFNALKLKEKLTVAQLQNLVLEEKSILEILEHVCVI